MSLHYSKTGMELGKFREVRDGVPLEFRITTVPPRLSEAVVQHMSTFYLPREPMFSHYKFFEDPITRGVIEEMWRGQIATGIALVALREGEGEEAERIIGANITYLTHKGEETPEVVKGSALESLYEAIDDIAERAQIFEKYSVDSYLNAFGLSVHPHYHGYKLGERLLQARKPLCKTIGIKVTATMFTHVKSMHLSKKIGFVVLYGEEYSKYTYNGTILFKGMPGKFEQSAWEF